MQTKTAPNASTTVAFAAVSLIFGSSFLLTKVLVEELTPLQVVAARTTLGAAVVVAMLAMQGSVPRMKWRLVAGVTVLALLDGVIPHTLVASAQTSIDSGVTSVLIATMPLFTAIFAWLLLPEERFTAAKALGLVVGMLGVVVLVGGNGSQLTHPSTGHLLVLLAAMSYGVAVVYARSLLASHDAASLTGLKLLFSAVIAVALTLGVDGSPHEATLSARGWLAIAALGIVSTGIARVMYFWVIERAGSVHASLIAYVVPVVGVVMGWAVLSEPLRASTIGGMALIIVGVACVMYGQGLVAVIATFRAHGVASVSRVGQPQSSRDDAVQTLGTPVLDLRVNNDHVASPPKVRERLDTAVRAQLTEARIEAIVSPLRRYFL